MPDNHLFQTLGERAASTGSKTTAYDQRNQQQVKRQVNVVIYQGRAIAISGVEAIAARAILRRVFPARSLLIVIPSQRSAGRIFSGPLPSGFLE